MTAQLVATVRMAAVYRVFLFGFVEESGARD